MAVGEMAPACGRFAAPGFGLPGRDQKFWPIEFWRIFALLRCPGDWRDPGGAGVDRQKKMMQLLHRRRIGPPVVFYGEHIDRSERSPITQLTGAAIAHSVIGPSTALG